MHIHIYIYICADSLNICMHVHCEAAETGAFGGVAPGFRSLDIYQCHASAVLAYGDGPSVAVLWVLVFCFRL